jgi:hypothetical protein
MVNICESLINVVKQNKPKVLSSPARANRLGPKGKGSGIGALHSPIADDESLAERRNLTHTGTGTERGKPEGLPVDRSTRESEPQGESMGLRVEDGRGSDTCTCVASAGEASL